MCTHSVRVVFPAMSTSSSTASDHDSVSSGQNQWVTEEPSTFVTRRLLRMGIGIEFVRREAHSGSMMIQINDGHSRYLIVHRMGIFFVEQSDVDASDDMELRSINEFGQSGHCRSLCALLRFMREIRQDDNNTAERRMSGSLASSGTTASERSSASTAGSL